jgi:hypothetical protein
VILDSLFVLVSHTRLLELWWLNQIAILLWLCVLPTGNCLHSLVCGQLGCPSDCEQFTYICSWAIKQPLGGHYLTANFPVMDCLNYYEPASWLFCVGVAFPPTPDLRFTVLDLWLAVPSPRPRIYHIRQTVFCAYPLEFYLSYVGQGGDLCGPSLLCYPSWGCWRLHAKIVLLHLVLLSPVGASAHLRTLLLLSWLSMAYTCTCFVMRTFSWTFYICLQDVYMCSTEICAWTLTFRLPRPDIWLLSWSLYIFLFQVFHCCGIGGLIISLQTKLY